ncbi:MAG: hypothetical protein V1781_03310, partial [Bacteroidota bacterium]
MMLIFLNLNVFAQTVTITNPRSGQVAKANVLQGTTNHILHKFSLAVTGTNATLTKVQCGITGNYSSTDIVNLKLWYSADATFSTAVTLSTILTPSVTAG